jgi:hypothetical protein
LLDSLFLAILAIFVDRFSTLWVGVENARPGVKVKARVIAELHKNRFTIRNSFVMGQYGKELKAVPDVQRLT